MGLSCHEGSVPHRSFILIFQMCAGQHYGQQDNISSAQKDNEISEISEN